MQHSVSFTSAELEAHGLVTRANRGFSCTTTTFDQSVSMVHKDVDYILQLAERIKSERQVTIMSNTRRF